MATVTHACVCLVQTCNLSSSENTPKIRITSVVASLSTDEINDKFQLGVCVCACAAGSCGLCLTNQMSTGSQTEFVPSMLCVFLCLTNEFVIDSSIHQLIGGRSRYLAASLMRTYAATRPTGSSSDSVRRLTMGSFRRPRPRFMSSPVLSDLARFHASSASLQISNSSVWNR